MLRRFRPFLLALLAGVPLDPSARGQDAFRSHAVLASLGLQEVAQALEFRVLYEPPKQAAADFPARLEELLVAWLAPLVARCQEDIVGPAKLTLRAGAPPATVVVLSRSATFENAARYATPRPPPSARRAQWREPAAAVTWWDPSLARAPLSEQRWPMLAAAAQHWLARFDHRTSEQALEQRWLLEGLAGYVASHAEGARPADLAAREPCAQALARMAKAQATPECARAALLPFAELVAADEPKARAALAATRAQSAGLDLGPLGAEGYFAEQAALWMHFLLHAEDGRWRANTLAYAAALLGGLDVKIEKLHASFGVVASEELDALCLAYVTELVQARATDAAAPVVGVAHPELLPRAKSERERSARALAPATSGALRSALAGLAQELAELTERDGDAAADGPLGVEHARLAAVVAARDAFAAGLPGAGKRLRLTLAGKPAAIEVARIEGEELVFTKARAGLERIALEAIPLVDLAHSMAGVAAEPKVVATLLVVAGEADWAAGLAPEEVSELASFAELVREARAHAALRALAAPPVAPEPAAREQRLEAIRSVLQEHGASEALRSVIVPLRKHAAELLEASFQAGAGLGSALAGAVEELGGDRVRITYSFDTEDQLADWVRADGYLPDAHARLPATVVAPGADRIVVSGGNLEALGKVAVRHRLPLAAPCKVEYELIYGRARQGEAVNSNVLVAVCDDGAASYVGAWDIFDLDAIELRERVVNLAREEGPRGVQPAKAYPVELAHAGAEATLAVAGKRVRSVAVRGREEGSLLLWFHTDTPVALTRLVVEGRLAAGALERMRRSWVEGRLKDLGL